MSEQPGRYQRSFSGLVAALVVIVVVIGAFVAFRGAFRGDLERPPEPVDYLTTVGYAQDAGVEVVYPAALPEGWIATSVDLTPGGTPDWALGMLTDDDRFVGVRQRDEDVDDLLGVYVDEDPADVEELGEEQVASAVADRWQVFRDTGGDRAYAAEVGQTVVLVYGSAPEEDLLALLKRLTTEPVG